MRWLAAWVLYWMCDATYCFLRAWGFNSPSAGALYTTYSKLGIWSSEIQGPSNHGPWSAEIGDGGTTV